MPLLFRRKMPISIRFRLRPVPGDKQKDTPQPLQIRISVDGREDGGFAARFAHLPGCPDVLADTYQYGEPICLVPVDICRPEPGQWEQKKQIVRGRDVESVEINQRLTELRASITSLYQEQLRRCDAGTGPKPDTLTVKSQFITGEVPTLKLGLPHRFSKAAIERHISLLDAYRIYMVHLKTTQKSNALSDSTLEKWSYGLNYLSRYINEKFRADAVTRGWAKEYHAWLTENGPMAREAATRYVKRIEEVLDYLADEGVLRSNVLARMPLPRQGTADVNFLNKEQLEKFWAIDLPTPTGRAVLWWLGVMILTGLDFPDAERFVENPEKYTHYGVGGKKIVMKRGKKPHTECRPPFRGELDAMLKHIPKKQINANTILRYTDAVASLIGYEHRFDIKTCRKTAGACFLWMGHTMAAVSGFLGHSAVSITERYYLKVTGDYSDHEMERVRKLNSLDGYGSDRNREAV